MGKVEILLQTKLFRQIKMGKTEMKKMRLYKTGYNSIVVKMAAGFLALFLALIVILNVVYLNSISIIINKKKTLNKNLTNSYIQNVDKILEKSDAILYNLSTEISEFDGYEELTMEDKLELLNTKSVTFGSEAEFMSVYIYLKNSQTIVSLNSSVNSVETFFDINWLQEYNNAGFLGYSMHYIYNRTIEEYGTQVLTAIRDFPLNSPNKTGAIVMNINRENLFQDFGAQINKNNETFICDKNGELIFGNEKNSEKVGGILKNGEDEAVVEIDGKKMFITRIVSSYNDWEYITVQSYADLISEIDGVKMALIIMVILAVIIMTIMVFAFSKKVYVPLVNLMDKIEENALLQSELYDKYNEFDYLESAIELLIKSKNRSDKSKAREGSVSGVFAEICSNGTVSDESLKAALLEPESFFVVSLIKIGNYENIYEKSEFKSMLLNKLKSVKEQGINIASGYILEDTILSLIALQSENDYQRLSDIFGEVKNDLKNVDDAIVTVGIGSVCSDKEKIYSSYKEALKILQFAVFTNQEEVMDAYKNEMPAFKIDYKKSIKLEIDYVTNLKRGDAKGAVSCLESIIEQIPQGALMEGKLSGLLWHFVDDIFAVIEELDMSAEETLGENYEELYEKFLKTNSPDTLKTILFEKIECFTSNLSGHRNISNQEIINRVKEYMEENCEQNITLTELADIVHLSPNYISTLFKKQYNKSFSAYLNMLKMQKAAQLLAETNKSVDEISVKLGYSNFRNFIRAFKNYYYVTPSQYRKEHAMKEIKNKE